MEALAKTTVLLCGPPIDAVGGGPTHIRNMLASTLSSRYRLCHFETGSRGAESPAKDEKPLTKALRLLTAPFTLAWAVVRTRARIVHLNSALDQKAFWRDLVYLLAGKMLRRKVILQLHGGSLSALCRFSWMRWIVRRTLSLPDAIVLLATSERREFSAFGITERVVIIPNGIDVAQYRGPLERHHSGRVQRLVYLGRLIRTKGIFELIDAVKTLRQDPQFARVELRIAGSGSAREEIERYVEDRQLATCITLVGPLYGAEKAAFLREADVFVFPSYHAEGLPYAILESLAAGTPVVASTVAGIPDVVVQGVHGFLVEPKDSAKVVTALRRLAQSEAELRVMSRACGEWAAEWLGLERLASQFDELYGAVSAGNGPRPGVGPETKMPAPQDGA